MVLLAMHRETTLSGCHDEVGYLGLEWMLDLICNHYFWYCMAAQVTNAIHASPLR